MSGNSTHEWKVRSMSKVDSAAAVAAADRANRSTAEWLTEAIREKLAREHEPIDGDVFPPGVAHVPALRGNNAPALTISEIGHAIDIIEHIAQLQGKAVPGRSRALVRARRLVTDLLMQQHDSA